MPKTGNTGSEHTYLKIQYYYHQKCRLYLYKVALLDSLFNTKSLSVDKKSDVQSCYSILK